jgi:hypothetical protein
LHPGLFCIGTEMEQRKKLLFDILSAASGEDSYGVGSCSDLFGGFLSQPPYFGGEQRRGFTFGLSSHRSCGQYGAVGRRKDGPDIPGLNAGGFAAPLVRAADTPIANGAKRGCDEGPGQTGALAGRARQAAELQSSAIDQRHHGLGVASACG